MRRTQLLALSAALLVLGFGTLAWQYGSSPTILRVAVGPADSEDVRLVTALAAALARDRDGIRLKVVSTRGASESARELDGGRVALAVIRPDILTPAKGQSITVMHRDAALLVTTAGRDLRTASDLAGRRVGIVRGIPANERILDTLAAFYDVAPHTIGHVMLEGPADAEAALRSGRVDAVLAVGPVSGRTLSDTVAAAAAAGGGPPIFIPVPEADAIAARSPVYEAIEIGRGAFGGSSARPAESFRTIGVHHRLVADADLSETTVSELTRLIYAVRPRLASEMSLANRIEAPETSKSSVLPIHPGAAAYYEGEVPTFLERYEDGFYLGIMLLSIVGSAFAGLASRNAGHRRSTTMVQLEQVMGLMTAARGAETHDALDALDQDADDLLRSVLERAGAGQLPEAGISAFTLGLDQARRAIAERRRGLGPEPERPRLLLAAE